MWARYSAFPVLCMYVFFGDQPERSVNITISHCSRHSAGGLHQWWKVEQEQSWPVNCSLIAMQLRAHWSGKQGAHCKSMFISTHLIFSTHQFFAAPCLPAPPAPLYTLTHTPQPRKRPQHLRANTNRTIRIHERNN